MRLLGERFAELKGVVSFPSLLLLRVRGGHKFKRDRIGDGLQRVCVGMRKAILLIER